MTGSEAWERAREFFLSHSCYAGEGWCQVNWILQKHDEIVRLVDDFLQPPPKTVLEIGFYTGGTTLMWRELGAKVVSIDVEYRDPALIRLLTEEGTLRFVHGDSHSPEVYAMVEGEYDMLFIDGDHAYESVKQDFLHYGGMASTVVFHDIVHPGGPNFPCGVPQFWRELTGNKHQVIQPGSNLGIGVLYR